MRCPTVSPSRLKTAQTCEFKYLLSYVWGWNDELFQYVFASEFGTAVHNTLQAYALSAGKIDHKEEYSRQIAASKPFARDMLLAPKKAQASFFIDKACQTCPFFKEGNCNLINKAVDKFNGCPAKLYNEGLTLVELAIKKYGKYYSTGIKSEENPGGKIIGVEAPATICWGVGENGQDIMMKGFIDLVVEYDEETLLVVDYKTGYSIPTFDDFTKDLQPRMYSYAAKIMFPQYKFYWTTFDYFRGSSHEYAFTPSEDLKTKQEVVSLYNSITQAKTVRRRPNDRVCKYMCNRPFCDKKWEQLKRGEDGANPDFKNREVKDD